VRALYEAAQQGVDVDLIVRDSCRIRPGLRGLSGHVRVVSILGRVLRGFAGAQGRERRFEVLQIPQEDAIGLLLDRQMLLLRLGELRHGLRR